MDAKKYPAPTSRASGPAATPQKVCLHRSCSNLLAVDDLHTSCAFCLGPEHLRQAILAPGSCPCCLPLSFRRKQRRLQRVEARIAEGEAVNLGPDLRNQFSTATQRPQPPSGNGAHQRPAATTTRPTSYSAACTSGYNDGHNYAPARKVPQPAEKRAQASHFNPFSTDAHTEMVPRPVERQARSAFKADRLDKAYPAAGQRPPPRPRQPAAPCTAAKASKAPGPYYPDEEPPIFPWERPYVGWEEDMDEVDPLDPPLQLSPSSYRVLDEAIYGEIIYEEEVFEEVVCGCDDNPPELDYEGDGQAGSLAARLASSPLRVTITDRDQAALEGDPDQVGAEAPPAPPLAMDESSLRSIYRMASARCGRAWPAGDLPIVDDESKWQGTVGDTPEPAEPVVLPLARGFRSFFTAQWKEPLKPFPAPRCREGLSLDTVDMASVAFSGLPPIDKTLAAFLLNPNAPRITPLIRAPVLPLKIDRDAAANNEKAFTSLACAGKHLNAGSLLQGSMTALLQQVGDTPTAEQMAEIRRLHNEAVLLNCGVTQHVGRAMTVAIVQERERWLNASPDLQDEVRAKLQKLPILPGGLFEGAMEVLALLADSQKQANAFRDIQQPPAPPRKPPPRQPPPRQSQRPPVRSGNRPTSKPQGRDAPQDYSKSSSGRSKSRKRDNHRRDDAPTAKRGSGRGRGSGQRK